MNNMNMYDILNKFRAISDSPATAAAAEQVEKLNGVKKDRLDEKYQGFEKTVKAVAKNPKVKDPEAVAAAIGRKKYGKAKFQKAAAAGKKLGEGEMGEGIVSDIKRGVKAATGVGRVKNAYQKHMSKADAGGGDKERQRAVKALYVGGPDTAEKAYDKAHKEKYGFKPKRTAMDENQTCMECGMYEGDCNCTHEGYMPAEEGNAFSGAVAKAKADGIQKGEKISVGGKQYPLKEKLSARGRKKFAALAPPKDKITFADKIAGAKKEVDEMLGDVAAEALKGAVKGVKKKVEGKGPWPGTSEYKTKFGEPGMKKGEKKKSSSGGEIEKTAKGIKHTAKDRSEEPDTDEPKSGEKRSRGRPKKYGDDKPRQERETAKSRKKDRTAHGQAGFKADKKKDKKEVDEKAVSKKQQRFMGMVHATQKGEKAPSAAVAKVAKSMGKKDAKDFASTKHKGLPE